MAKKGRKKHGYLLFDLPSDHEIEEGLSTECDVIRSMVTNMGLGNRVKAIRVATPQSLKSYPQYKYSVQYVHIACHGGSDGVGMVGGELAWPAFAKLIKRHLAPVPQDKKRVLCLSCCHSSDGLSKMASELRGHFTAAYHFTEDKIAFATAMATWAMFYSKKKLAAPHAKTREAINTFFQKSVLGFREL